MDNQTNQSRRGGKRPGAGRKPGRVNFATADQKDDLEGQARAYTSAALQTLVTIATKGKSEPARVTAASALLDRGYGKPRQGVEHTGPDGGPLVVTVTHRIVDPAR